MNESRRPLRVAHVITALGDGGAEQVLLQTVRRIDRTRYAPYVVSLRRPGVMSSAVEALGIPITHLAMTRLPGPATVWALARWFRRERIDIVHAYLYHASIVSRLAGRIARVPVVLTSTRSSLDYLPRPAWWLDRITAPLATRIVAVSRGTAAFIVDREHIAASRVTVISNGVDLDRFAPMEMNEARAALKVNPSAFVVAIIGRLHEQKGHEYLLRALADLRSRIPSMVCLIAGDGPLRTTIADQIQQLGLGGICRLLGRVPDPRPIYAAADVTVLPSLYEGMPNVVLEAMAMGCPVIASRVAGSEDLVKPGVTGILVPKGEVQPLADALHWVWTNWVPRMESVRQSIRHCAETQHGVDTMVHTVESLYAAEWLAHKPVGDRT